MAGGIKPIQPPADTTQPQLKVRQTKINAKLGRGDIPLLHSPKVRHSDPHRGWIVLLPQEYR